MTGSKPFPINPGFLAAIKSTLSIESDEDASQVTTIRKFLDEMACQVKVPKVDREDRIIEYGDIKVKISILRPVGSKDEVLPVVLFM
jgi:acetyl esterase